MDVKLAVSNKDSVNYLDIIIVNNTCDSFYINYFYYYDLIHIYNEKGKEITDSILLLELYNNAYHVEISKTRSCVFEYYRDYSELQNNYSERAQIIKNIIDSEYAKFIDDNNLKYCDDSIFIKDLIYAKYIYSIFILPKMKYTFCTSINTLFKDDHSYKILFEYPSLIDLKSSPFESVHLSGENYIIRIEPLKLINGYALFDKNLTSDTLYIKNKYWQ